MLERQRFIQVVLLDLDFAIEPPVSDENFEQELADVLQYEKIIIINLTKMKIMNYAGRTQTSKPQIENIGRKLNKDRKVKKRTDHSVAILLPTNVIKIYEINIVSELEHTVTG